MMEVLKTGFSLITAGIFAVGIGLVFVLLIEFGILNKTLHQIKEILENVNKNLERKSNKQKETYECKEK